MDGLEVQERSGMLQEEAGETAVLADAVCGPGTLALPVAHILVTPRTSHLYTLKGAA